MNLDIIESHKALFYFFYGEIQDILWLAWFSKAYPKERLKSIWHCNVVYFSISSHLSKSIFNLSFNIYKCVFDFVSICTDGSESILCFLRIFGIYWNFCLLYSNWPLSSNWQIFTKRTYYIVLIVSESKDIFSEQKTCTLSSFYWGSKTLMAKLHQYINYNCNQFYKSKYISNYETL